MRLTTGRPVSIIVLGCLGLLVPLLAVTLPAEAAPKLGPAHRVKGVSDGDTIRVVVKGRSERVRLIGIDTPELGRDGAADQCHAAAARRQMQQLVQGTLKPPLHRAHKRKRPMKAQLLELRRLAADWAASTEPEPATDYEVHGCHQLFVRSLA